MDSTGETQVWRTDLDCCATATTSKQPRVVGYNVQSAVETKHHPIVAREVTTHGYDRDALWRLCECAHSRRSRYYAVVVNQILGMLRLRVRGEIAG